jgi:sugar phosphate isomerase/epimerase
MINKIICALLIMTIFSCKESKNDQIHADFEKLPLKISLAQWSFHKAMMSGEMDNFSFIDMAHQLEFGGVEYVALFLKDKSEDTAFLDSLNAHAEKMGIAQLLIMIDGEGDLGVQNEMDRDSAVENHKKWIRAAQHLGCYAVRVNAFGDGSREEQKSAMIDALKKLGAYARDYKINVLVENHGGLSSDGAWLSEVMKEVDMDNVGTLPDFGNFCIEREDGARWEAPCVKEYDKYKGSEELMPFALAVSAKSYDFDDEGSETTIDYGRMLDIVKAHHYDGFIGVEYEGSRLPELQGVIATRDLIIREW